MILLDAQLLFGRLHPLVVHLPIGFLMLAFIFNITVYFKKLPNLQVAVPFTLLLGAISASVACLFGWLLSETGDYGAKTLENHKFSGLAIAAISFLLFYLTTPHFQQKIVLPGKLYTGLMIGLMGLLSYSGHQGGNLTHGSDYLSIETLTKKDRVPPETLDKALVFEDVIEPLLEKRCKQCHSGSKIKGDLKMTSLAEMLKGGKSGPAIVPGDSKKSEIFHRITLDPSDEDFMPTDGKTPLTKNEVKMIEWWINKANAAPEKSIAELKPDPATQTLFAVALGFAKGEAGEEGDDLANINPEIPKTTDLAAIEKAKEAGFTVRVMLQNPMMLDVKLAPNKTFTAAKIDSKLQLLKPIAKNIILLNLSELALNDAQLAFLKECSNLEKLRIEKNPIGDATVSHLAHLKHLKAVNFYQTDLSKTGLQNLSKLPSIRSIYAFQSKVGSMDTSAILKEKPDLEIVL